MNTSIKEEKEQINWVKQELLQLKDYVSKVHFYSTVQQDSLRVEDDLVSYLHYTKSIVAVNETRNTRFEPVLEAMEMQYRSRKEVSKLHQRMYAMLQAIDHLPSAEKELLVDIYIRGYDKKTIYRHQGQIVESTYYRRMNRACLHVFSYLQGSYDWLEKT